MDTTVIVLTLVVALGLLMAAVGNGGARARQLRRIRHQQAKMDAKLDAVLDHLGIALPAPEHPEVERLVAEGSTVRAMKAYRDQTGAELTEAKDAVEEIARRRGLPLR